MNMEKAKKAIRNGWIAAIISGVWTLVLSLTAAFGFTRLGIPDACLVLGLAFGVYKKSRVAAVILFVYWVAGKILEMPEMLGEPTQLIGFLLVSIVFACFFFYGMRGTFAYHRIAKEEKEADVLTLK